MSNITLDELIRTGDEIREGISLVPPQRGVIRTYTAYTLKDSKAYANWKGLVNLYLSCIKVGSYEQEVRDLFVKFEKYCYRPQIIQEIIGILNALNKIVDSVEVNSSPIKNSTGTTKVFIVHGHNEEYIEKVARFLEKLECEPIILKEQPNSGKTIIEKFEELSDADFGVVIYTNCDRGSVNEDNATLKPRARQNVIFEHGYLYARLGRNRVCALVQDGVEIPSDLSGVLYVSIDKNDSWKFQLAKEMKNAGISIDMNKI